MLATSYIHHTCTICHTPYTIQVLRYFWPCLSAALHIHLASYGEVGEGGAGVAERDTREDRCVYRGVR
ncbi:hypothetical protein EON63_21095 [archaeon]|nr:MAG: hypothetical protein EON63_21095 [archaeon]